MLFMGALTMNSNYLIPFIAHCIAGISLFLGATEATFYLGLQCFKGGEMQDCKYIMISGLSVLSLICVCVFLTFSRKLYLEIKKDDTSSRMIPQERWFLKYCHCLTLFNPKNVKSWSHFHVYLRLKRYKSYSSVYFQMPGIIATWEVMATRLQVLGITVMVVGGQSFFSVKRVRNKIQ